MCLICLEGWKLNLVAGCPKDILCNNTLWKILCYRMSQRCTLEKCSLENTLLQAVLKDRRGPRLSQVDIGVKDLCLNFCCCSLFWTLLNAEVLKTKKCNYYRLTQVLQRSVKRREKSKIKKVKAQKNDKLLITGKLKSCGGGRVGACSYEPWRNLVNRYFHY